jgi:integrase
MVGARARKHGKGYYFKNLPGTEEFASEYQRWLARYDSEREGIRGTKPGRRCAAHGLRKAACRRGAEAGWTVHQIASWSGHKTLKEVERYTRAADQKRLAESAMNISVAKPESIMAKRGVSN